VTSKVIDITGTGNNRLVISIDAVKAASSTTDTLEVVSNAGDTIVFGDGWKAETPRFINGQFSHVITETTGGGTARVEVRNDRPLTNPLTPFDVDRNGNIQPLDALRIINEITRRGSGAIAIPTNDAEANRPYFDVSGDMQLTAADALRVINALSRINRGLSPSGELAPAIALSPSMTAESELGPVTSAASDQVPTPRRQKPSFETMQHALDPASIDNFFVGYDEEDLGVNEGTLGLLSNE
jgi:hypothetical protein